LPLAPSLQIILRIPAVLLRLHRPSPSAGPYRRLAPVLRWSRYSLRSVPSAVPRPRVPAASSTRARSSRKPADLLPQATPWPTLLDSAIHANELVQVHCEVHLCKINSIAHLVCSFASAWRSQVRISLEANSQTFYSFVIPR
jgi:hypothetical protein